ncbi:hypothetical protein F7725_016374 [Dissostichus mawsoni]|uniref:Dedicator of cytokinesis N-terminal domain-containing protein n=1 Tax=Dissostichus mawsoni TaxID=36200 RepID=A0A7J5Z3E7_DISMA|nr:hypothetical protein F7725_016374 [Dissostichus mawsoni]
MPHFDKSSLTVMSLHVSALLLRQVTRQHLPPQVQQLQHHMTHLIEQTPLGSLKASLKQGQHRLDYRHMGLDLVPRKEFEMADGRGQRHGEPCRVPVPHHLLVNLKSFTYNSIGEDTDIFFSLYDLREGKTISEKFMVRLNKNGGPKNPEKVDRLCALFTDLSNKDMKRDLYIVSQLNS